MFKIYYLIWVDAIFKAKSVNKDNWKFASIIYLSAFLSIVFMSLVMILESVIPKYIDYSIFSKNNMKESLFIKLELVILYFIPSLIFNYFLIFHNRRSEKLLKKYKSNNGKYLIGFMLFSLGFYLVALIFTIIWAK